MATNLEITGAVKRTQKGAADWYYGGDNEAWPDMATALANIPASVRPGKTIGIFAGPAIVEYWWPTQAVADINLVSKTPDLSAYATTGYVDSSLVSAMKLRGDWDISTATYPTTGGSGTGGAIKEGNAWRISTAGTIGAQSFEVSDFIVALTDSPAQTPTNWTVLEHNNQQATETTAGTTKIATQATTQTETTTNDTDTVTPKKLWQGITRYASIAWTIIGDRIFNGLVSIVRSVPELRFVTQDGAYARFQRSIVTNNNQFVGKNGVLQVGGIGKAIQFNNINQYFTGSDIGLPSGSSIMLSIAFWCKTDANNEVLFSYGESANGVSIRTLFNNYITFIVGGASAVRADLPASLSQNTWHHIVFVIDNNVCTSYLDGIIGGSGTLGSYNVLLNGIFSSNTSGALYNGAIDQLLIYNTILTGSNILAIYNSGAGTSTPPVIGLIRRYEFEEGDGSTTADINPNGTQYPLTFINYVNSQWLSVGIAPVAASSTESVFFSITDGLTNAERGVATWGDFAGRNQQTGKWFQWSQNNTYPLCSNNSGQFKFANNNMSANIPIIASTIDISGNITIGVNYSGSNPAPDNGVLIEGNMLVGTLNDNFADKVQVAGNISMVKPGDKLKIATGTNASIGVAKLINGTITINTTIVTADSIIFYCVNTTNGTPGLLSLGTISSGTSFIIQSSDSADNSIINWWIIN